MRTIMIMVMILLTAIANAQDGECTDGLCGTPEEAGGGGGGGSILIQKSDQGDTYQYADDYDEDGVEDTFDNCPFTFNPLQFDSDGDDIGTECDVCINSFDPEQTDTDFDGQGDVCDDDLDGDGNANIEDNCQFTPNPERPQVDIDGDGFGDVCDPDDNGNGTVDAYEHVSILNDLLEAVRLMVLLEIDVPQEETLPQPHTDEAPPDLDEEFADTGCSVTF